MSKKQSRPETFSSKVLALYRHNLDLIRVLEKEITLAARDGKDTKTLVDQHLQLRASALGVLVTYSQLTGLPDPRILVQEDQPHE